jgi:hypothetical protein
MRCTLRTLGTGCLALASVTALAVERLPFRSGFETGSFSEWQGGLDTTLTVSTSSAFSGQYAARAQMTPGQITDNYKDFYFGDHRSVGGAAVDQDGLWLRFYAKLDSGFNFGSQSLHKLALINFTDSAGQRRYQIIVNIQPATERYILENLSWRADGSFDRSLFALGQNVGTPSVVRYGQWDKIKLYILPNTPGQSDGVVRLWINDELKLAYTNVPMRESTNFNPNKLILSNHVPRTDVSGVQWWDDFYLGEVDPDAQGAVPNAPTDLSTH